MKENRIYGLVCALMLSCGTFAVLHADMGMEITQGAGDYRQQTWTLDVPVAGKLSMGLCYSRTASADAPDPLNTYSAGLGATLNDHVSVRGSATNSPEANGLKSSGWGVAGSYGGGNGGIAWSLAMAVNQMFSSAYWESVTIVQNQKGKNQRTTTATSSGWQGLAQQSIAPSFNVDLFGKVNLACGCAVYSYDRDVSEFSAELAGAAVPVTYFRGNRVFSTSTDLGDLSSLVSGFPARQFSAGIAVCPLRQLRTACDWSQIEYVADRSPVHSAMFSAAYAFRSMVTAKLGYTIVSTDEKFVTASMQWSW